MSITTKSTLVLAIIASGLMLGGCQQNQIGDAPPELSRATDTGDIELIGEVLRNNDKAVIWVTKAAEKGIAEAQNNLGLMYEKGYGGEKDYNEAVKWYRKAAEQDYVNAQCSLGFMYANGYGVDKDYTEAAKWYIKSAEKDYASSQYNLGWLYRQGYGVTKDYAEAVKWYRRAGEQGNPAGENSLGWIRESQEPTLRSRHPSWKAERRLK
jgi:TPR repeat protein